MVTCLFIFCVGFYKLKAVVLLLAKSLLALFGNGHCLRLKLTAALLNHSYDEDVKQDGCQQNQHIEPRFFNRPISVQYNNGFC